MITKINKKKYNVFIIIMNKFNIIGIICGSFLFICMLIIFVLKKWHLKINRYIKNLLGFTKNSKKIKSSDININDRVEILMDKYNIKSTEKTKVNLKYLIDSPTYINFNQSKGIKVDYLNNNELKKLSRDTLSNKIIENFIYNKKLFVELFIEQNDKYTISNLENFYEFQKKSVQWGNPIKYNILLKFTGKNNYQYIFVNNSDLIKIKKYEEYEKISQLLEKNNDIFLIRKNTESGEKYFVTYGGYVTCRVDSNKLQHTIFKNKQSDGKNYKLLSSFDNVKIYFYVCTQIDGYN
jgi:hypothetical protein